MKQSLPVESERQQRSRPHLTVDNMSPISQDFVDNRVSTAVQRQLMAKMANSPQVIAQRKLSEQMNNSPRMTAQRRQMAKASSGTVQRVEGEEELLQGKFSPIQRVEEEELMQGKFNVAQRVEEEELLQGKFAPIQRVEEEELLQGKFSVTQLAQSSEEKQNNTGLPDNLKQGIENLSGMSMDGVKVHYNSSKPAQLNALAYAQGTDIHLAPGQEQHLPHEAWHVVQQAQGRVKPTMQMAGQQVNDDQGLEQEADLMGERAISAEVVQTGWQAGVSIEGPIGSRILQQKCRACEKKEESIQLVASTAITPVQLKGTITECEDYHQYYKDNPPRKCTQNHTKDEMEANVIDTQVHIDGRQMYIDEECDYVLPGSIKKGSEIALASHQTELASVKRTLATCEDKIDRGKYKR